MPRSMTVAGICSEGGASRSSGAGDPDEAASNNSVTSEAPSSLSQERIILVAHILPLHAQRRADNLGWTFFWDEDSLLLQLRDGLPAEMEVLYIGCLKEEVEVSEQDEVAATLFENFNCVPAFFDSDVRSRFYQGFCKQQLWPLFHYMLPLTPDHGGRFDRCLWQAYVSVNKVFADKVMEVINPDDDYVWVHDYHLMVLPTFLRKRFNRVRLGFFLHSPFPSSEIYRTLPVRDEILRALLNSDLIGFHTFDYARHFLSCCSRMLGLEFESKRGYIGLEYYGRTVGIKIMPVGIHMSQLQARLKLPDTKWRIGELRAQLGGKIVLLGVDDMDIFKGIELKLLAMEQLLKQHPEWKGRLILVQVANPARSRGKDVQELEEEVKLIADRINDAFGYDGYQPVMLLGRHVPLYERIAFYTVAECCVVTAVRDGMNLIPYEYIVCRESSTLDGISTPSPTASALTSTNPTSLKKSMLIVSEFIGCSPSLSGAIRVNPWNIEAVAEAMNMAVTMSESEKHMRHEKHFRYVKSHDVDFWSASFVADLERTCRDHARRRCYGIGFGLGFRVVALDPNFRKLLTEQIVAAYKQSKSRALLLDYDGTMKSQTSINRKPTPEVLAVLNTLCSDRRNVVFIVSGRDRATLGSWFAGCEALGIAAEHGYFYRYVRQPSVLELCPF